MKKPTLEESLRDAFDEEDLGPDAVARMAAAVEAAAGGRAGPGAGEAPRVVVLQRPEGGGRLGRDLAVAAFSAMISVASVGLLYGLGPAGPQPAPSESWMDERAAARPDEAAEEPGLPAGDTPPAAGTEEDGHRVIRRVRRIRRGDEVEHRVVVVVVGEDDPFEAERLEELAEQHARELEEEVDVEVWEDEVDEFDRPRGFDAGAWHDEGYRGDADEYDLGGYPVEVEVYPGAWEGPPGPPDWDLPPPPPCCPPPPPPPPEPACCFEDVDDSDWYEPRRPRPSQRLRDRPFFPPAEPPPLEFETPGFRELEDDLADSGRPGEELELEAPGFHELREDLGRARERFRRGAWDVEVDF